MSNGNEVVVKQNTAVTEAASIAGNEVFGNLIKLPRLSLMQKMSKPVEEEKAKVGDLFENLGNTVVCGKDAPFDFIPLVIKPIVTKYKPNEKGQYIYESHVSMTAANQNPEWEKVENGITKRYRPEIQVYLLSVNDLEKGGDALVLPYLYTFRGASMPKGGKSLYTFALLLQAQNKKAFEYKFTMTNKKEEKDGNTFQVSYVEQPKNKVDLEKHGGLIDMWITTLSSMANVEVAEEIEEFEPKKESIQF